MPGDVIVAVNRNPVATFNELQRALADLGKGQDIVFKVLRQNESRGMLTGFLSEERRHE